ncbi:hypothetical protein JCGZ_22614 [Jatropha curcas]|uniref:BHLH domain-containing protein n=2 Tax=Jatropha curcas TaxID=180498 RepID=A0A067JZW0_JATCU|nr:transcription factor bHLH52 isoform X2 [Jatropha curcas]KDP25079.1 hypothetical protein JCGZ_22614 [Jatropha curcas]
MSSSFSSSYSDIETAFNQHQLSLLTGDQFLDYTENNFDFLLNTFVDPFYDSVNFLNYSDNLLLCESPKTYAPEDFNLAYPNTKRPKCNNTEDFCCYSYSDYFTQPPTSVQVNSDDNNGGKKMNMEVRSVSAQSIAARERRRKITDKTQLLGRLIPGGSKMNTAEMLQAAYKYVKYLQAQLGVLRFLFGSSQLKAKDIKELQILGSASFQEKLYMQEKCLVPNEIALILTNNQDVNSDTSISDLTLLFNDK